MITTYEDLASEIARRTGSNKDYVYDLMMSDNIGGFNMNVPGQVNKDWGFMSMHESEGRALYTMVRLKKPKIVAEIGSFRGCSTSHLAAACRDNGMGKVLAIDPAMNLCDVDPELLSYVEQYRNSCFDWTYPEKIDFLLEDGAHTQGFTRDALIRFLPWMNPGSVVISHDFCVPESYPWIEGEFRSVMGDNYFSFKIAPSWCGMGICML